MVVIANVVGNLCFQQYGFFENFFLPVFLVMFVIGAKSQTTTTNNYMCVFF